MNPKNLPINVFDVVLFAMLFAGVMQGRKHGMSEELMKTLKWIFVLVCASMAYQPFGGWLARNSPFSLLTSYMVVYVLITALVLAGFALVQRSIGGKLVGSDIFGRAEYYLGMGSGLVRLSCVLLAGLALLNARYFSPSEVKAMDDFQNDVYGSTYFPTWHTAQAAVFQRSMSGPWIKDHFNFLFITPTEPEQKELRRRDFSMP